MTSEEYESQIEELNDRVIDLESKCDSLTDERDELTDERDSLQKVLVAASDKAYEVEAYLKTIQSDAEDAINDNEDVMIEVKNLRL